MNNGKGAKDQSNRATRPPQPSLPPPIPITAASASASAADYVEYEGENIMDKAKYQEINRELEILIKELYTTYVLVDHFQTENQDLFWKKLNHIVECYEKIHGLSANFNDIMIPKELLYRLDSPNKADTNPMAYTKEKLTQIEQEISALHTVQQSSKVLSDMLHQTSSSSSN